MSKRRVGNGPGKERLRRLRVANASLGFLALVSLVFSSPWQAVDFLAKHPRKAPSNGGLGLPLSLPLFAQLTQKTFENLPFSSPLLRLHPRGHRENQRRFSAPPLIVPKTESDSIGHIGSINWLVSKEK